MKKLLLVFAFLFLSGRGIAQNDFAHAAMDSLQKILYRQKTPRDSLLILQKMVDFTPIRQDETSGFPDHVGMLLKLNTQLKLIDPAPYLLIQQGNAYWAKRQYGQALKSLQGAVTLFDKQHKKIFPLLINIRILYNFLNTQEDRLKYYQQKLEYYQVNGPYENTAPCYHGMAGYYLLRGAYNQAINNYLKGGEIFRKFDPHFYAQILFVVGMTYNQWGNFDKALDFTSKALPLIKKTKDTSGINYCEYIFSEISFSTGKYEDALAHINESIRYMSKTMSQRVVAIITLKAGIYLKLNQPDLALPLLNSAQKLTDSAGYKTVSSVGYTEIDYNYYEYYLAKGNTVQAEKSLLQASQKATNEKGVPLQLKYLRELGYFYQKQNQPQKSEQYFENYFNTYDALEKGRHEFKVAEFEIDQNDRIQREHIDQLKQEKATQDRLLWSSLLVFLLISASLIFIYRQLQVNKKTLRSLRETQRQLIQSEKMASLGELTAGIAHEIQNPLNFVNNFSEVNKEMLEELKAESKKPKADRDEQLETELINDLIENEQKINHHGKRADAIVKGMLEHSRAGSGQKEPTDINALADEYLRLSYHGLRAKDKSFNAEMVTNFDETLPKLNLIPQDMGRVLLNLFNNAFYAVNQKQKTDGSDYKPEVSVSTLTENGQVVIKVKDNGIGIPDAIKEKVMHPFFTTKPTGEGTGLGLSLTYDMVVKGHGGSIKVDSVENSFTEITVTVPLI